MTRSALLSAAILASFPALAQPAVSGTTGQQQSSSEAHDAAATSETEDSRVHCRSVYQTNSRIPERICRTRAQWAEIQRQSREELERNRRNSGASGDGG